MNYLLSIDELDRYEAGGVVVQGIDASTSDWAVLNGMCATLDGDIRSLESDYVGLSATASPADFTAVATAQGEFINFQTRWSAFYSAMQDRGSSLLSLDYPNSVHQFVMFRDEYQEKRKKLIALGATPTAPDRPFLPPPSAKQPWGLPAGVPWWIWAGAAIGLLVVAPMLAGPGAFAFARKVL